MEDSTIDVPDLFNDEPKAEPTAAPASSATETKAEVPAVEEDKTPDAPAETETDGDAKPEDDTTPDAAPADETDTEEPKKGAEARKEQLNSEIRELVASRNQIRHEIGRLASQAYAPQTAEELVDAGEDPALARVEALEQRTQLAEFTAHVSDLNATLNTEALQVMHDFPVFDPESDSFDSDLAGRAQAVYQRAAGLMTDPKTGMIYQANATPYEIFKAFAETHAASAKTGEVKGQRASDKMLAASDTPSSAAPKTAKVDPVLALWQED